MKAIEFIEAKRDTLNEKSKEFWSEPILFFALQRAYNSLQTDVPYFLAQEDILGVKDQWKYRLEHKMIKPISVLVDGVEYRVVANSKFFKVLKIESGICTTYNHDLGISKAPFQDGEKIDIRYKYLDEIKNIDCEIKLPEHYMEALSHSFFAKVWEKNPSRDNRVLVNAYKRDYEIEKNMLKNFGKVKSKGVRSKYKKV